MRGQTGHTAVRVGGGGGIVSDWRDDREREFFPQKAYQSE